MGVLLLCGFGASSAFSYFSARGILDRQLANTTLPLTAQALSGEVEQFLTPQGLLSSSMARNTFLESWVAAGERDQSAIVGYLRNIQAEHGATTAFFVSDRTGRYYHLDGVIKSVSPSDPNDRWFYRVQASADPFEVNIDRDTADPNRVTAFTNFRVLDRAGGFIGSIGLGIDVRELARELNRYQDRYGARVLLVTHAGQVVLSPGADSGATLKEVPGLAPYVSRILNQPATSLQFPHGEGQLFVNSRQIPELGWVIVVLQQNDPSTAALLPILAQNLLIALAVSAVVLLLANATVGNYQRQLQQLAITDKLTGLLNRTALDTMFNRVVKDALRRQEPLAVMLFDIDFFKLINDSHGHALGDQMIQHVAAVLQRSTRGSDLLFRWGGEEFLLLLPGCSASQAMERCERQRQILLSEPLAASSSSAEPIAPPTLSCGVTTYQQGETLKELLLRADQALYTAKRGGRDRVVCLEAEAPLLGRIDPKPSTPA